MRPKLKYTCSVQPYMATSPLRFTSICTTSIQPTFPFQCQTIKIPNLWIRMATKLHATIFQVNLSVMLLAISVFDFFCTVYFVFCFVSNWRTHMLTQGTNNHQPSLPQIYICLLPHPFIRIELHGFVVYIFRAISTGSRCAWVCVLCVYKKFFFLLLCSYKRLRWHYHIIRVFYYVICHFGWGLRVGKCDIFGITFSCDVCFAAIRSGVRVWRRGRSLARSPCPPGIYDDTMTWYGWRRLSPQRLSTGTQSLSASNNGAGLVEPIRYMGGTLEIALFYHHLSISVWSGWSYLDRDFFIFFFFLATLNFLFCLYFQLLMRHTG